MANGHLQATGRDARGRKQYRYHPLWRSMRDDNKYEHMIAFGYALPKIRHRVTLDLQKPMLSRENIMATVVRLLELTLIRVGNEEYARTNKSYGITTLRNRHVEISGNRLLFKFRGKSGQSHEIALTDQKLSRIVKRCRDMPGQDLFQYIDDDGERHTVSSSDVNDYLKDITGEDFTAKDFRTWAGTVLAAATLHESDLEAAKKIEQQAELERKAVENKNNNHEESADKKIIVEAIKTVAAQLGNTPAICRRCYVHPRVIDAYLDGSLLSAFTTTIPAATNTALRGLYKEERSVLQLLEGDTNRVAVGRTH
ncbi:MAG: topoisomerase [Verrucomicrobiaceae bacterium]|nr:topoisomerase [Verrucomicrobiaceae bacterium]